MRTYLSAITIGELYYGIALCEPTQRTRLEAWLAGDVLTEFRARVLAFDAVVAARWGALRARARRAGTTMSAMDAAIAATSAYHDLTLVTRNERDFLQTDVATYNPWI